MKVQTFCTGVETRPRVASAVPPVTWMRPSVPRMTDDSASSPPELLATVAAITRLIRAMTSASDCSADVIVIVFGASSSTWITSVSPPVKSVG